MADPADCAVAAQGECVVRADASGATERQLQNFAGEGLQEMSFKDRGHGADGLLVEFTDIDYVEREI
ncbi:hypothetical protein [Streptomyces decoyicus]|uniref:hypothetical protein n=1 Tax=Streptomyces decoyicus TaxID=249567 RepID=UPI002E183790|nr:hypothetical protein OG532_00595 [Streptomyces decoyicus]